MICRLSRYRLFQMPNVENIVFERCPIRWDGAAIKILTLFVIFRVNLGRNSIYSTYVFFWKTKNFDLAANLEYILYPKKYSRVDVNPIMYKEFPFTLLSITV